MQKITYTLTRRPEIDSHKVGNSAYDPKAMLKLVVYGYSYGIKGSRKLERAVHENLAFMAERGRRQKYQSGRHALTLHE